MNNTSFIILATAIVLTALSVLFGGTFTGAVLAFASTWLYAAALVLSIF